MHIYMTRSMWSLPYRGLRAAAIIPLLLLLLSVSAARGAIDATMSKPSFGAAQIGAPANDAVQDYLKMAATVFTSVDAKMTAVDLDQDKAQDDAEAGFEPLALKLSQAMQMARSHVGDKGLPEGIEDWFETQTKALDLCRELAGHSARVTSMMMGSASVLTGNWVPVIEAKKKKLRETGKELNRQYNIALGSLGTASSERVVKAAIDGYRPYVTQAKTLQMTLLDTMNGLIEDVEQGSPDELIGDWLDDILLKLTQAEQALPYDPIFQTSLWAWSEQLNAAYKAMVAAHEEVMKVSASLRKQTLFRNLDSPLKGLEYALIYPTFKALLDDAEGNWQAYKDNYLAEEEQWEKDRQAILDLIRDGCSASDDRDMELKAARAGGGAEKEREIKLGYARRDPPEWEDYLEQHKNGGRSEAELKSEWTQKKKGADQWRDAQQAELDKARARVAKEEKDREAHCVENDKKISEIKKNNAKRRNKLGMSPKPFSR